MNIVDDQVGAPTWCRTIAQVTATVLAQMPDHADARQALSGVYHLSPGGSTSWFGFASAIRDALGLQCDSAPDPCQRLPDTGSAPA